MPYYAKRAVVWAFVALLSPAAFVGFMFEFLRGGFVLGALVGESAARTLLNKLK